MIRILITLFIETIIELDDDAVVIEINEDGSASSRPESKTIIIEFLRSIIVYDEAINGLNEHAISRGYDWSHKNQRWAVYWR